MIKTVEPTGGCVRVPRDSCSAVDGASSKFPEQDLCLLCDDVDSTSLFQFL